MCSIIGIDATWNNCRALQIRLLRSLTGLAMGSASRICGRGGLLRKSAGLLLLDCVTLLLLVQVTTEDLLPGHILGANFVASSDASLCRKASVNCRTMLSTSAVSLPATVNLVRRGLRSDFPRQSGHALTLVPATPTGYGLVTTFDPISLRSSRLSSPSTKQSQNPAPASALVPSPAGDTSSTSSNASFVPPSLAEPPISHHSGCCRLNMVRKRGTRDCQCVYPVKVELFLWNVSQSPSWSNEFLKELASQLNLRVDQFEIDNFYLVGLSGLNITMDIAPHTGMSFSLDQVHAMNTSLTFHEISIDPNVVGGYKVLNFTWIVPPAPSPAPALALSPKTSPRSMPYLHAPYSDASDGNHRNLTIIVAICAAVLVFVVIVVLVICLCTFGKGKKSQARDLGKVMRPVDTASVEGSLPHPTSTRFLAYEELREATNNFEPGSVLGEGGFGRVFKGVLSDGTAVAIKKLNSGGHQGDREFLVEVEMLSRLHHRNLVKLVGYYSSRESSQNLLCYELVPNGSLEAWLHGPLGANCPLNWDTRMKIALDAARGLAYLHEDSQPSVIHRDFKASNILLENNFHAKVSDFGLAKQAPEGRANYLSTRVMGTFGYVAPEYAMTGHLLVKSDVYSYGVVLLELLTGRRPVDMSQPSGQENLVTWARPILRDKDRLEELADPKLEGKYPKEDFVRACTIAAACVAPEASQRPAMGEVVQSLKMVQQVAEYQEMMPTPSARPNIRQSSTTYESDGTSSMFSSGPFSGLSGFDNENISRTAFSEDLHEGRFQICMIRIVLTISSLGKVGLPVIGLFMYRFFPLSRHFGLLGNPRFPALSWSFSASSTCPVMAFWWPLVVLGIAFVICRFLLLLIPPNVPSIEVDASDVLEDGSQTKDDSFIYIPSKGKQGQKDRVQCYEPATMKYLGFFPALTSEEVKEHVAQARKAQNIWAKSSFRKRRQFLRILLKYIIEHQELICEVSSRDTGKTMVDASLGEIMTTCEKITWLLAEGEKWLKPEYRSCGRSMLHKRAKVEFHPLGVIGAIISWNYPFHNIFNPMLAAVFSGNGVVIKVSEHASWSGCFYFRIIQAALGAVGAPDNLVHVITGFGETGQALVSSVDKIIFVGSPGVGRMVMQRAADTLIPVTLELGGKDAFIVCEDVDASHVVQIAVRGALQSSGQNCAGAERFYVHRDIYPTFVAQIVKLVKSVTAGPPLSGKYDMGAICMQEHADKLQNLVNDALEKGAEIVGRGSFGNLGEDAVDQFFPPTVIVNVNHTMKLMQEEAFGPIIPIMKFETDDEAINLANDSNYGLGCAVFSRNKKRAIDITSQIHCGVAAINDFASTYMCQSLPFGGVKHSGFGRFAGVEGLRACCLVKSVVEDRWWPYIKTVIPKPIQYPISENGFEFQESLVEALYGLNVWDRLRALVNVLKIISEHNSTTSADKKRQ